MDEHTWTAWATCYLHACNGLSQCYALLYFPVVSFLGGIRKGPWAALWDIRHGMVDGGCIGACSTGPVMWASHAGVQFTRTLGQPEVICRTCCSDLFCFALLLSARAQVPLSLSLSSHTRILHLICMQCSFRGCNIICMRIKACLVHVFLIMNGRGQSFIFIWDKN